jgi:hypothetical protein
VGCSNVSLYQPNASTLHSDECGLVTDLASNITNQNRPCQKQQSGQSWYARLPLEKKAEYIQRQRIARQQKKAAAQSGVNLKVHAPTGASDSPISQRTPLSNITNTHATGT